MVAQLADSMRGYWLGAWVLDGYLVVGWIPGCWFDTQLADG